jgi:ferredoxin-type protein NapH
MSLRRTVQIISALFLNPILPNFVRGTIYGGALKQVCIPALNCYSCPAAVGACPIGSLQVMLSSVRGYLSGKCEVSAAWAAGYVAGAIALVGALCGRFPCGWVCPFGFLHDVLYRRKDRPSPLPWWARFVKYALLVGLVIALPLALTSPSSPLFCKFICPAGTAEAGIPLVGYDRILGEGIYPVGLLFTWKIALMAGFLGGALVASRFFCRTACPLGAAWGLFNGVSLVGLEVDKGECTQCGFCKAVCPMDIGIFESPGDAECIRCLKCTACPHSAVKVVVRGITGGQAEPEET